MRSPFLCPPLDKRELKEQIIECVQKTKEHEQDRKIVFENVRDGNGDIIPVAGLKTKDILYCKYMDLLSTARQHVNLSHIKRLKGYSIYLDNGEKLLLAQNVHQISKKR